jgi:hypothetical protein
VGLQNCVSLWRDIEAGNECGDMVHGQKHSCWFVPLLEQCYWKVIPTFLLLEGASVVYSWILCNVALLSVPTTRI